MPFMLQMPGSTQSHPMSTNFDLSKYTLLVANTSSTYNPFSDSTIPNPTSAQEILQHFSTNQDRQEEAGFRLSMLVMHTIKCNLLGMIQRVAEQRQYAGRCDETDACPAIEWRRSTTMKKIVYLSLLLIFLFPLSHALANDTDLYILTQLMQQVPPDALILLDLSGSMGRTPAGGTLYFDPGTCTHNCGDNIAYYPTSGSSYTSSCSSSGANFAQNSSHCSTGPLYQGSGTGHTYSCTGVPSTLYYDPGTCPHNCGDNKLHITDNDSPHRNPCDQGNGDAIWGDSTCAGPYYTSSGTGHTTNCSKVAIAKRAIFTFLDADNGTGTGTPDGIINANDQSYLKIRMGYMRYYNCSSNPETVNSTSYNSGCNTLIDSLNTAYSTIYCNSSTSCTASSSGSSQASRARVHREEPRLRLR